MPEHRDGVWRFLLRYRPVAIDATVDGRDCYVFHRDDETLGKRKLHIIPVNEFWAT